MHLVDCKGALHATILATVLHRTDGTPNNFARFLEYAAALPTKPLRQHKNAPHDWALRPFLGIIYIETYLKVTIAKLLSPIRDIDIATE